MKILIVDDEKQNLKLLQKQLERFDHKVFSAGNGAQALDMLQTSQGPGFEMIISDILMPIMDGYQLCRAVRGNEKIKDVFFVLYSGTYIDTKDKILADKIGADAFIQKPAGIDELMGVINKIKQDQKAKRTPMEPDPQAEILKLYSERLVQKLEKKMLELQDEVAKRQDVEQKLLRSKESFRNIVEKVVDGIVVLDHKGYIKLINPAARLLFDRKAEFAEDELFGFPVCKGESTELDVIRSDGNKVIVEMRIAQTQWEGKGAYLASLRDITKRHEQTTELMMANIKLKAEIEERKKVQASLSEAYLKLKDTQFQLIQAAKMELVGRLASGVAHEVKNPLAIIMQGIDYLAQAVSTDDENVTQTLNFMVNAVDRADTIVKDLLDFSSAKPLELSPQNLNAIVEESLMLVKHEFERRHIEIDTDLNHPLPCAALDRNKLKQVFINLFINAAEAMPTGGKLIIKTYIQNLSNLKSDLPAKISTYSKPRGPVAIIEIKDTGMGIEAKNLDKIFNPFFTTRLREEGTGLGLSIVKRIIDMHDGRIEIKNRPKGGAKVIVMLKV
ncbi:MAG: response regulator [Desulfobacula sp.]|jgi:two-component system, cell cycle sensor histidine kinase and response regulator CckA|uniref:ATP-binding response regulator n=1 Tax=Desulfobacula sp. TaxID=2593537 RepID=UPI001DECBCF6|nr:response regulator [Desulfobacula sp.]MBT3485730.1 response regulator [Desulfobacula sp.]MBT3805151.1 response regulator [Desulfobacula sp.]MBT4025544.1 response regulator [Desulfobacula sp.]MBT4198943.1 response regulator [Desulfobacula sp.]